MYLKMIPEDYIINATMKCLWTLQSDFVIKAIKIINDTPEPICGNYVVLRHDNEEYSLYGHLQYHSLTVKKGETVKQGQPIGRLGNTGKSGCPHLHFQLMNGPDYSTARGLPCHFTNIVDAMKNPLSLIREEYTIVVAE